MKSYPLCFASEEQWKFWNNQARYSRAGPSGYCSDCTPEYQSEMLRARRCEHPNVLFGVDNEGFLCGSRPEADEELAQIKAARRKALLPA